MKKNCTIDRDLYYPWNFQISKIEDSYLNMAYFIAEIKDNIEIKEISNLYKSFSVIFQDSYIKNYNLEVLKDSKEKDTVYRRTK